MINDHDSADLNVAKSKAKKTPLLNWAIIISGAFLIGAGGYFIATNQNWFSNTSKSIANKSTTYKTIGNIEVHESKDINSIVRGILKENSVVSGHSVGKVDGNEWVEITSVDGLHGFVPITALQKTGDGADLSQVQQVQRNIVTSTSVNIRALPSIAAGVLGYIDGGTRLVSDGFVNSQGEDWLRIKVGPDKTGFIMARFTTPDDEGQNADQVGAAKVGVPGVVIDIANVQATPFADGRILRSLVKGDNVGIIGQTKADDYWYIVRLDDGTQGFVQRASLNIPAGSGKWVYPDGSQAPGPNIPQVKSGVAGAANNGAISGNYAGQRKARISHGADANGGSNTAPANPSDGVKVDFDKPASPPSPAPEAAPNEPKQ